MRLVVQSSPSTLLTVAISLMSVIVAVRRPVTGGLSMWIVFLDMAFHETLRNIISVLSAVTLIGIVNYQGLYIAGLMISGMLIFIGSVDIQRHTVTLAEPAGPLLLAGMIAIASLSGALAGHLRRQHALEREVLELRERLRAQTTARVLHDSVARSVTSIVLRSERELARRGTPLADGEVLERIAEDSRHAMEEISSIIRLYSNGSETTSSPCYRSVDLTIKDMASYIQGHGFTVRVSGEMPTITCDRATQEVLSLVLPELATNIIKYSRDASEVELQIRSSSKFLEVLLFNLVETGVDRRIAGTGLGLQNSRKLITSIGGTLESGNQNGRWETKLQLPLEATLS